MKTAVTLLLAASFCAWAANPLGKPLTLKQQTAIADLAAKPADFVGRTVQVKGAVTEVCEEAGCWMKLVDPATKASVRIKVKDGEIVFPQEAIGRMAVAEGRFAKIEMTREQAVAQAKHEAGANRKKFDPAGIKGPVTLYQIQGTGAVID